MEKIHTHADMDVLFVLETFEGASRDLQREEFGNTHYNPPSGNFIYLFADFQPKMQIRGNLKTIFNKKKKIKKYQYFAVSILHSCFSMVIFLQKKMNKKIPM